MAMVLILRVVWMLVITTLTNAYSIPKTIMGSNNIDPNDPKNYLSMEGINRLDAEFRKYSIDFKNRIPVLFRELSLLEFYLWTPLVVNNNAEQQQPWIFNATVSPQELINHGFLKNRETKFIAHGWNSAGQFADIFRIGYYSHPDVKNHYNIISIHWNPLAPWYNYFVAAINSVNIGQFVGQVIGLDLLINGLGQSPDKIHAIGHSLGAHLAGHFARIIKNGAGPIKRVTGLDPAKPWFDLADDSNRIGKNDAQIVDIIHTNSGFLLNGGLSFMEAIGDVDFYPNGGQHQPGCADACFANICLQISLWDFFNGCSHSRAIQYYVESIFIQDRFLSSPCTSWDEFRNGKCHSEDMLKLPVLSMGENLSIESVKIHLKQGNQTKFYLATNVDAPFSF